MATENFDLTLKSERATLELVFNDLYQIYSVGKSVVVSKETAQVEQFSAMYETLPSLRVQYMSQFTQCLDMAIRADSEALFPTKEDTKKRSEFNIYYYKIIEFYVKCTPKDIKSNKSNVNESTFSNTMLNSSMFLQSRLPKINLPHFSGSITEWSRYKELFCSMVHSNTDIPEIQRFHYLSSTLKGEALNVISAFTISEDNYNKAWDALCKRYDNNRLLATTYIEKILNYSPPSGSCTFTTLQQFISTIAENIAAFKSINVPDESGFIWLSLALRKLDTDTRRQFETSCVNTDWPTFQQLESFIRGRCKVLQLATPSLNTSDLPPDVKPQRNSKGYIFTTTNSPNIKICSCRQQHPLHECLIFRGRSIGGRKSFLKGRNICYNCLKPGHFVASCPSPFRCKICRGKHHTLLHHTEFKKLDADPPVATERDQFSQTNCSPSGGAKSCKEIVASVTGPTRVLLGTALIDMLDVNGHSHTVRALIDPGSQFPLITTDCAQRLGLRWRANTGKPLGVGESPLRNVKGKLKCTIISKLNHKCRFVLEPLVLPKITGPLPACTLMPPQHQQLDSLNLADPAFWRSNDIDILLAADLFISILTGAPIELDVNYKAVPTTLGLIVMGRSNAPISTLEKIHCHCLTEAPISSEIFTRFWEVEDSILEPFTTPSDPCEDDFIKNHYRDSTGRYVVSLPFKESPEDLKSSKELAIRRLKSLEIKMEGNPIFKAKYHSFMNEYISLGHMCPTSTSSGFVIPHHGVFKQNDPNSKIRVVFDASAKTATGSLNDKLHVGANLQCDLSKIILKFRCHPIAVTADMVKMYRQVLIRPEDRRFQHIVWRDNPCEPLQTFQLNTVTYGTKPAMFLAKRAIIQLVHDEGDPYPQASRALLEESYVDDIVSGAANEEEALKLKNELTILLGKGKFEIHKWSSNSVKFMRSLGTKVEGLELDLSPKDAPATRILGMAWDSKDDQFYYDVKPEGCGMTKRAILSVIARLFDPMGFLSPSIFKAKTIFQATWMSTKGGRKIDWDEEPEQHLAQEWCDFSSNLHHLNMVQIPRFILSLSTRALQIVGFSDASQKGFAAAIYLRTISADGGIKISLLQSKTRLAPIKTISIPRLELSAAHLLIKLFLSLKPSFGSLDISESYFFTDSTIVLSWLKLSPHLLQTFVANRVSFIITHTSAEQWHHVTSKENPADIASRGIGPEHLRSLSLWWAGPTWLHDSSWNPSPPPELSGEIPELKMGVSLLIDSEEPELISCINRHSNYRTTVRTFAYILRFIFNSRHSDNHHCGPLAVLEMEEALSLCIKVTQHHVFSGEFSWAENKPTSKRLLMLNAFADEQGIIRVGGRLANANLPEETKHPIVLPSQCNLTGLIIDYFHRINFHMGHQALQSFLRRRYWIFRLRQAIKTRIAKCLVCFKMKAQPQNPMMGNLPSCRVRPSRPFSNCGVDYAGPFQIKLSTRRNAPTSKAYLCIFVCMATRAVHLELVTALTTDAFISSLDRFVARRGKPHSIHSDCGTNFIGAARRLKELSDWLKGSDIQEKITTHAADQEITWSFNPPHAPHFGGIWEAAVKSAKHHLYRVVGDRAFHYEELVTFFTRIEAILNSRPLCALEDSNDGDVLTPGHFLIGAPLLALPERDLTNLKPNYLSRWQLVLNSVQHFWKRWHGEYIQTLQKRPKWYHNQRPLSKGDLVLISDPSSLPLNWKIARIEKCHPGNDNITRVVTIRDSRGVRKLPVHTLVSLSHLCEPEVDRC